MAAHGDSRRTETSVNVSERKFTDQTGVCLACFEPVGFIILLFAYLDFEDCRILLKCKQKHQKR